MSDGDRIVIGRPWLPPLDELTRGLAEIWESGWVTNFGAKHEELERRLAERLGAEHLALTASGTAALQLGCGALGLTGGEAITTPLTFPATLNALRLNGVTPVLCDVEPERLTLDPGAVEQAIGPRTVAIVPVHLFGGAAFAAELDDVAAGHGLPVLYDAAHAFGVEIDGRPVARFGAATAFSFHATKVFHTIEGGALSVAAGAADAAARALRNHGFPQGGELAAPAINAKMNELEALVGLHGLATFDGEVARRAEIDARYRERLEDVPGISPLAAQPGVRHNHCYFALLADDADAARVRLDRAGVESRRYFPLLASEAEAAGLPCARSASERLLCLPIHGAMSDADVDRVCAALAACPDPGH